MFVLVTLNFLFPLEEHPAIIVSWLYLLTFSCEETFNLHSTRHPALSGYMYSQLTASWESDIILYYQNVHLFCNASLWEIGILFGIHWSCYVYKCKKMGPVNCCGCDGVSISSQRILGKKVEFSWGNISSTHRVSSSRVMHPLEHAKWRPHWPSGLCNSRVKDRNLKYISSILFVTCGKRASTWNVKKKDQFTSFFVVMRMSQVY